LIEKYYFIAQIEEVATSLPPLSNPLITYSSGGLTTLRVSQQLPDKLSWCRKVLLFCAPGSPPSALFEQNDAPQPALQKGNWIGVRRGAVWDMAIDNHGHSDSAQDAALPEKWLVGAEWDILPAEYGLA
jgi:pimeloyl-ACP methyl ester carboxylesterase